VVAVAVDRRDDVGDSHLPTADAAEVRGDEGADALDAPLDQADSAVRTARFADYQATVEAANRAYAIDEGCARVRETEETVITPAMRSIESEDATRHLAGFENRLKGKERLTEKVITAVNERGHTVAEALGMVKDAIRYTFCYPDRGYTKGVYADCAHLENAGFECVDRQNSWTGEQYKGINSRWRVPANGQLFEVQFHTTASLEAKETTHPAYEKLRVGVPTPAEQRDLENFQKRVTATVPVPPGATEIPDYP
jgi:hypothetical protein